MRLTELEKFAHPCVIGWLCGRCKGTGDELFEFISQRVVRTPGVLVGFLDAFGARVKKRAIFLPDSASAILLTLPGRCLKLTVKLCCAAWSSNRQSNVRSWGCFADFFPCLYDR